MRMRECVSSARLDNVECAESPRGADVLANYRSAAVMQFATRVENTGPRQTDRPTETIELCNKIQTHTQYPSAIRMHPHSLYQLVDGTADDYCSGARNS